MEKHQHHALKVSGNQEEFGRFMRTEIIDLDTHKGEYKVMYTAMGLLPEVLKHMNYKRKCAFLKGYSHSILERIERQVIQYDSDLINKISIFGECFELDAFSTCRNCVEIIEEDNLAVLIAFEFHYSDLWLDLLRIEYPSLRFESKQVWLENYIDGIKHQVIFNHGRIDDDLEYPDELEIEII